MPLIHMNGNSRERLTEYYEEAARALREEALQKFNEIDFHPRNYYPLGPEKRLLLGPFMRPLFRSRTVIFLSSCSPSMGNEAFTQAQAERIEIYKAFQRIQDYLEKHIEHLYADV